MVYFGSCRIRYTILFNLILLELDIVKYLFQAKESLLDGDLFIEARICGFLRYASYCGYVGLEFIYIIVGDFINLVLYALYGFIEKKLHVVKNCGC